ncbi:MAG: Uma2 family endonuclease [Synechococcales cyanobacterium CRU_2_2]|nr:Uma2 family endonuclease [Synechococcales cyanobacterium CRU_2_2]
MTQALSFEPAAIEFDHYLATYPNDGGRYELINGSIIPVNPSGEHEQVGGFLDRRVWQAIGQNPYLIPRTCTVKPFAPLTGYKPDLIVLDETALPNEPRWKKESTILQGSSIILAIEIVSTNWREDYDRKAGDYEEMGIPELWIVDYRALGGRRYIGYPKQPTFSVYQLIGGEYQVTLFRAGEQIQSAAFPQLCLATNDVFAAAG